MSASTPYSSRARSARPTRPTDDAYVTSLSEEYVRTHRRGGRVPQREFPLGRLYGLDAAMAFRHTALTKACTLAWRMLGTARSRAILNLALQADSQGNLPTSESTEIADRIDG